MKIQRYNTLTLFIFLINTVFVFGMEQNNYATLAQKAEAYNRTHLLLCLPLEIQQQIVFSGYIDDACYTDDTKLEKEKMDELSKVIKTFFVCNIICKHFNTKLTLPWAGFELTKKNKMLQKISSHMPVLDYKIYRLVPLALIYSGASADVKSQYWGTSLYKAVYETDESAVAMLLNYKADPYQFAPKSDRLLCFYAKTPEIAQLFLARVDKDALLSKSGCAAWHLAHSYYSLEIMKFWLDYGVCMYEYNNTNILHQLADCLCEYNTAMDAFIQKGKFLLARIPDKINVKNNEGRTFRDVVEDRIKSGFCNIKVDDYDKIEALFLQYDAKTSKKLEECIQ